MKFVVKKEKEEEKEKEISHINLPRLVVLTGLNGSGKTRGLKDMASRAGMHTQYIDYANFKARWDTEAFENSHGDHARLGRQRKFADFFAPENVNSSDNRLSCPLVRMSSSAEKEAWLNDPTNTSGMARMYKAFLRIFPEAKTLPFERHAEVFTNQTRMDAYWRETNDSEISSIFEKYRQKPAHLIYELELITAEHEFLGRKAPLNHPLIEEFQTYHRDLLNFLYEKYLADVPKQDALDEFVRNRPRPWDTLNDLLEKLRNKEKESGVFQFRLHDDFAKSHPVNFRELQDYSVPPPQELLVDIKTGKPRRIDDLSSGERALLALVTLLYTHRNVQPHLDELYLDEIDASLHPSMIEAMLEILQELSGDTRVYLATHSPSTVALAPEESLFLVEEGKARKMGRTEALEGLTQGYLTTEGISSVFRRLKGIDKQIIVISEGKNYEYLEPLFQKVGIAEQCHIHRYKKTRIGSRGVNELKVLHHLFCDLIDTLPNGRKYVFLVDCEESQKVKAWNESGNAHVKALALKEIEANPVKRGIENVVPDFLLSELEKEFGKSIYASHEDPSKGIKDKNRVSQKFIEELKSPNSRIDIEMFKHTLSDLIALCTTQSLQNNRHTHQLCIV